MKYSLRTKLSLSYLMVALVTTSLIIIMTNVFLERQFQEYVQQNQEQKILQLVTSIGQQYSEGQWDSDNIQKIGLNAMGDGLIIRAADDSGRIMWDARVHNNGECQRIIAQMAEVMGRHYPTMQGGYVENTYPLLSGQQTVGQVVIGYYGPFYLTNADLHFIDTLDRLMIGLGIFCMLLAIGLGTVIARRLSLPISRVINSSQMIARGFYGDRIIEKSNTIEIGQLVAAVNNLADSLQAQESLRKRLTGDVAHELRTPLATLQSHLEAMIDGIWAADKPRLESCHEEILRLNRLVGDLETLSRYDQENLTLEKSEFNLTELVNSLARNFAREFAQKKVELALSDLPVLVQADRDKISQVAVNLLANSLKYTPAGGRVEIDIRRAGPEALITVRDNGIGIAAADLPHIFERFYRADPSRTRATGGSGIGLAIVRSIIEAHGGKIEVKSSPGQGSEFLVHLPNLTSDEGLR